MHASLCALGCLEIIVDLLISVFLGVALSVFSVDGCFFLKCGVVEWFLGFSLRVNPILDASLMALLHASIGCVVFYASYETWIALSGSCERYCEHG